METLWVLSLVLKSLVTVTQSQGCQRLPELFKPQFVQAISCLAMSGTGFSRRWLVSDLEVSTIST